MAKQLWEPMDGETAKAFEAFDHYRRLPPGERSLQRAWEDYRQRPGNALQRSKKSAGRPYGHFTRWMSKWRWRERALAWDAEQAEIERDQRLDRELRERAKAHEEELRQRQLMREEARAARAVGRRILLRILQGVDAGQLDELALSELLPHLAKASTLLEVGQKLDRLFQGQPTDVTRLETDRRETVGKLVAVMQEFVPEERWEELARKLDSLEADE